MLRTAPPLHVSAVKVGTIILLQICAAHESLRGPSCHFVATQQFDRFRSKADIQRAALAEPKLSQALEVW
jgi:hypothetical protein